MLMFFYQGSCFRFGLLLLVVFMDNLGIQVTSRIQAGVIIFEFSDIGIVFDRIVLPPLNYSWSLDQAHNNGLKTQVFQEGHMNSAPNYRFD